MSMFGPKMGTWWVKSKINPNWNHVGRGFVGGFIMPKECEEHLENIKKKLGDFPKDLTWGYMKD